MKKLLAVLLAVAMLGSFAVVGAVAEETEPELTMEDVWPLIEDVQEILNGGRFTISARRVGMQVSDLESMEISMNDNRVASQRLWRPADRPTSLLSIREDVLFGRYRRLITTPDANYIVFPGRRIYARIDPGVEVNTAAIDILQNLIPEHAPADTVRLTEREDGTWLALIWESHNWGNIVNSWYEVNYHFVDGELNRIAVWFSDAEIGYTYMIDDFSPQADERFFSTRWMVRLPWWLMSWLMRRPPSNWYFH